jgi:alpha-D-ribose 1-methylphosphonate 5-phosphate C-P lyase
MVSLEVQGADLIDGTPILDIKPYIPYGDRIQDATGGFAEEIPRPKLQVEFTPLAQQQIILYQHATPELELLIRETLCLDPRPAYRRAKEDLQEYGVLLDSYNVRWKVRAEQLLILEILPVK